MSSSYFTYWLAAEPPFPQPPAEVIGPLALPPLAQGAFLSTTPELQDASELPPAAPDELAYRAWLYRGLDEIDSVINDAMASVVQQVVEQLIPDMQAVIDARDELLNPIYTRLRLEWFRVAAAAQEVGQLLTGQLTIDQAPIGQVRDEIHDELRTAIHAAGNA